MQPITRVSAQETIDRQIAFIEKRCDTRGFHRVRHFDPDIARCIDCGKEGSLDWATRQLLTEHPAVAA